MSPTQVSPEEPGVLGQMQDLVSRQLRDDALRCSFHPGDLAWWVYHADPRDQGTITYWLEGDIGLAVLDSDRVGVVAITVPGVSPVPLMEWGLGRLGPRAKVSEVSTLDAEAEAGLREIGLEPADHFGPLFAQTLDQVESGPSLPFGWELRPLEGEDEADARRRASHAAFESTMDPTAHLERYLRFMRSPVYDRERDLVAVAPDGRIASFIVWWPDPSGIAQIEPFGTDPAYQRQGSGRSLMLYALGRMRAAGMTVARVLTDAHRDDAIGFYQAVGFDQVADLRDWHRP